MDSCSLSNPSQVAVTHYDWIAQPDFSTRCFTATINIKAKIVSDNVKNLVCY